MKNKRWIGAAVAGLLGLASACSTDLEGVAPQMGAEETRQAVLGKWRIERVDNKLCRSGNCNTLVYQGAPGDFFELRADSAFMFRAGLSTSSHVYLDKFKADYKYRGVFVLSNAEWSARFEVKARTADKLILESTFTGTDPNAVFTDTYLLYR